MRGSHKLSSGTNVMTIKKAIMLTHMGMSGGISLKLERIIVAIVCMNSSVSFLK